MTARPERFILPRALRRPLLSYLTLILAVLAGVGFIVAGELATSETVRTIWFCASPLPAIADVFLERFSWRGQQVRAALELHEEMAAKGHLPMVREGHEDFLARISGERHGQGVQVYADGAE